MLRRQPVEPGSCAPTGGRVISAGQAAPGATVGLVVPLLYCGSREPADPLLVWPCLGLPFTNNTCFRKGSSLVCW